MNGVECRLESGCLTQPLSLAYDKVQMKIKHLGCTAVSIVTVFVILSLSCTRSPRLSSETAAETPSDQPSFPGEDSPDAADAAPESFEPEVAAVQEPTEQPESGPVENVAAEGAAEDIEPPIEQPGIELPENLVIDEVTPYLDFFFERDNRELEWLYNNEDYIAARENFSFLSGRSVEPRYFPVLDNFPMGLPNGMFIPDEAGFRGNKVYIDTAPGEDLTLKARNTIDGKTYSHILEAESFYSLPSDFNYASTDSAWWTASFPFLPTYFLTRQRFELELVGSDGSIITAGESTAYLEWEDWNAPIAEPRVSPFQNEMGFERDRTMYLPRLPKAPSYLVLYKVFDYLLIPVASTFLESEPSVDNPVKIYFGPDFPFGSYSFEVIDPYSTITSQYNAPEKVDFRESGFISVLIFTAGFTAPSAP